MLLSVLFRNGRINYAGAALFVIYSHELAKAMLAFDEPDLHAPSWHGRWLYALTTADLALI